MSSHVKRIDDATRDQIACLKAALADMTAERDKEIKNRNGWRDAAGSNMKHLMHEIEFRDAALALRPPVPTLRVPTGRIHPRHEGSVGRSALPVRNHRLRARTDC